MPVKPERRKTPKSKAVIADHKEEKALLSRGYKFIAGVDEVGRGALAGPVVAAAVILPAKIGRDMAGKVRDSKQLNHGRREVLFDIIMKHAIAVGIGIVASEVIDEINILNATRRAMAEAISRLDPVPDYLLIDGRTLLRLKFLQKAIIKGDCKCISIASASIIAKVTRDRMMIDFDREYPGYGLAEHKGYGTSMHLECLGKSGPCAIHRRTFGPVKQAVRMI
jgi:ribonuclease HII